MSTTLPAPAPASTPGEAPGGQSRFDDPDFEVQLTPLGQSLLEFRYLQTRPDGGRERPVELFRRVARHVAEAERGFDPNLDDLGVRAWAERFFDLMVDGRFLPNAPTLLGAGTELGQLHACFVLPVADSVDGVFDALRMAAVVHARGGGTGFSFSALRPNGTPITTGGVATGPVPLLRVFDTETEVLKQGGTGWGANMGVLRCDHPDVAAFVAAKSGGALRNFNLSVGVTDDFMDAVRSGRRFTLRDPATGAAAGDVDARSLFATICEHAWRRGDPGLLFLDRVAADNPTPDLGPIEATNPCGEAPLLPFEACCLGGINVARFARGDRNRPGRVEDVIDWAALDETAALALRMMDDVIEMSRYPLDEIRAATLRTRKIGIGVMGFADLLLACGIPYDSDDAVDLARTLMARIRTATRAASVALAAARGPYPAFGESVDAAAGHDPMRNATTTSNAPNSTIGPMAGCSPGIEPLYALGFERVLADGTREAVVHPGFLAVAEARGFASAELLDAVRHHGSVADRTDVPDDVRRLFVTAHDIDPEWHVRIQAGFQDHTDLGVSKTINLPNDATADQVGELFLLAHELGCKGTTVFRDGCESEQFLVRGTTTAADPDTSESDPDVGPTGGVCEVCA